MNSWKDYVRQTFLKKTRYTGNKEPGRRVFSGSMLGNDPLINYLKFKHGSNDDTEFGANTLGSVFHLGAEEVFKEEPNTDTEFSLSRKLDNGWTISGSIDLILHDYKKIVDWKLTTATTIKNVNKERRRNNYVLQLGVYKYLMYHATKEVYETALGVADKGFSHFKDNKNDQLELMDLATFDVDEIEAMLYEKTNELDEYIKLDQEPPRCKNLFVYAPRGQRAIKMRCRHYCDNNMHCSHFNEEQDAINSILNL